MEKVGCESAVTSFCETSLLPKKLVQLMERNNSLSPESNKDNNQVDIVYASSGSDFKENEYSQLKNIVDSLISLSACNGKSVNNVDIEDPKEDSMKSWWPSDTESGNTDKKEPREQKSSTDSISFNPSIYYGVCIPSGTNLTEDDTEFIGVFSDKKEALRAVKKYKGARFKAFKSHSEALNFANQSDEQIVLSPSYRNGSCSNKDPENSAELGSVGEKPSPFKAPKSQDLVKLRKAIESGDSEFVTQTIWSNPRYLISNGDTPAILQEGSRYNALHVAAKSKQTAMAKLILETIDNPKFMQLLYSEDNETTCLQRVQFLTDLYLNTPDKAISETPLHFAAKFGCAKIVDILASHPACIKNLKNKYGKTAQEIVCSRCPNESLELKSQIIGYLQDRCYVPVLRSEDNSTQPMIGSPWSPESIKEGQAFKVPNVSTSPVETPMAVKAFAGPMSPSQAAEFHKRWRNYPSSRTANNSYLRHIKIRLSDTEKGLERIGRELALELKVPWTEYWSFLKSYCNFATPEGLSKLETYLKKKYEELVIEDSHWKDNHSQHIFSEISQVISDKKSLSSAEEKFNESLKSLESSDLSILCERLNRLCLNNSDSAHSSDRSQRFSSMKPSIQYKQHTISDEPYQTNGNPSSDEKNEDAPLSSNISVFLDRTCQVIANQITYQAKTTAESSQEYWFSSRLPYQMFTKAILPFAKCLMNIISNVQVSSELKESYLRTVHHSVARKVVENISEDEYVSVFLEQFSKEHKNETISDSSDDDDEFQCWPRRYKYREKQINPALMKVINQHNNCILTLLCNVQNNPLSSVVVECNCTWPNHQFLHEDSRSRQSLMSFDQRNLSQEAYKDESEEKSSPRSSSPIHCALEDILSHSSCGASSCSDYSDVFITPPSSRHSSRSSSINEVVTPDEGIAVFILGSYPTKLDLDVLRALENASIDPILYPHIYRWHHLMMSFSKEAIESWPSPFCPRARKRSDRFHSYGSSIPGSPPPTLSPLARYPLSSTPTKSYPGTEYQNNLEYSQVNLYKKFFQNKEDDSQ